MAELTVPFRVSKIGEQPKPYIHIELTCPNSGKSVKAAAIVDTGADECAFPTGFAQILEIDLDNAELNSTATAGGPTNSFVSRVKIQAFADNHQIDFPEDKVYFMENLQIPILGVRTFLQFFKFTIDYPNKCFLMSLSENESKVLIKEVDQIPYDVDHGTWGN